MTTQLTRAEWATQKTQSAQERIDRVRYLTNIYLLRPQSVWERIRTNWRDVVVDFLYALQPGYHGRPPLRQRQERVRELIAELDGVIENHPWLGCNTVDSVLSHTEWFLGIGGCPRSPEYARCTCYLRKHDHDEFVAFLQEAQRASIAGWKRSRHE